MEKKGRLFITLLFLFLFLPIINSAEFGYNYLENPNSFFGEVEFDGGWMDGGASIINGDGYFQNLFVYNISSLNVTKQNLTILEFLNIDGILDVSGDSHLIGNVGIGTDSPNWDLSMEGFNLITSYFDTNGGTDAYLIRMDDDKMKFSVDTDNDGNVNINTMTLDNTGKVGIGTTSPDQKLQIDMTGALGIGAVDRNDNLFLLRTDAAGLGNYGGSIGFSRADGAANLRSAAIASVQTGADSDNMGIAFLTHPSNTGDWTIVQQMVIDHDGNVGIGTASPTNQLHILTTNDNTYALRVQGSTHNAAGVWTGIGIAGESANTKAAILFEDIGESYSRGKLHFALNNEINQNGATPTDAIMTLLPDGNVGIGTDSPVGKLDVKGSAFNSLVTSHTGLTINSGSVTAGSGNFGTGIEFTKLGGINKWDKKAAIVPVQTGADEDQLGLAFFVANSTTANTNPIEAMRIDYGGNVGIGTTVPLETLQVDGGSSETIARFDSTNAFPSLQIRGVGSNQHPLLSFRNDAIQVGVIGVDEANDILTFGRSSVNDDYMVIDSSGKVGIGTMSPDFKLQVDGDIVSETTGTDSIGTSIIRWLKGWFVDLDVSNNLTVGGNITADNVFLPQYIFIHTNKNISILGASVWTNISFSQEDADIKVGITHTFNDVTNETFTINSDGIYEINFNYDVIDFSLGATDIDIAGRLIYVNGTEIIGSVFEVDVTKQEIEGEVSHDFLARFYSGEQVIFQFIATDGDVQISTHGTFGDHPDSATIIMKKIANL